MKTLKYIGNTIFYLIILLLLVFSITNITVKKEDDIPAIFNRGFVSVLTDSMNGNHQEHKVHSFKKDALVFVKTLNQKEKENLKIGDVIVFYGQLSIDDPTQKAFIIHRIVYIDPIKKTVYTQGDKVNQENPFDINQTNNSQYEVNYLKDIKAIATSTIPKVGGTITYLRTSLGFALWILIPLLLFIIIEVIILVRRILQKNKEQLTTKYEVEKELLKQQLLEELKKKQNEK